jgi:acetyl esterase/lipase
MAVPKQPLFLYIHGGGFIGGDSKNFEALLVTDRSGIISATVDCNLTPETKWLQR